MRNNSVSFSESAINAFCFALLDSSGSYGSTSNAFILSLHNREGLPTFKNKVTANPPWAIYRSSSFGPTFGLGHDILVVDDANSIANSFTNFGVSYAVPSEVHKLAQLRFLCFFF